jgi:hypothetical protein
LAQAQGVTDGISPIEMVGQLKTAIPAMPPTEGYMLQTSMLNPEVTDGNTHQHEQ